MTTLLATCLCAVTVAAAPFEGGGKLYRAVQSGSLTGTVRYLKGEDVNQQYMDGETLLMCSASGGHLDIAKLLVDRGARVRDREFFGLDAFALAVVSKHFAIADFLLSKGAQVNDKVSPAIVYVAAAGVFPGVSYLLKHGADINAVASFSGSTALLEVIREERPRWVGLVLGFGADPRVAGKDGVTPLKKAVTEARGTHKRVIVQMILKALKRVRARNK
jgi:uncharacterized protein